MSLVYRAEVLRDRPVGYWPCDETSGTTATGYGSAGVNGTYSGGYTLGAVAFPGGGKIADFNGSTGSVVVPDNAAWSIPTTGKLTWECWTSIAGALGASGVYSVLFVKYGVAGADHEFYVDIETSGGTTLAFKTFIYNAAGIIYQTVSLDYLARVDRLMHVVTTYDGSGALRLYLDGRPIATTNSGSGGTALSGAATLILASDGTGGVTGGYGHAAIYDYVLPDSRIRAHYRVGSRRAA